ncbi:30S ribosomal protein S20 [bacterium]|nr:30S ribosomal protein S20 [bacterium]
MATHASALKRQRQNEKRRDRNRKTRANIRTLVKSLMAATKKEEAEKLFRKVESFIHKAAHKKVLHRKTAARRIAGLSRFVKKLAA